MKTNIIITLDADNGIDRVCSCPDTDLEDVLTEAHQLAEGNPVLHYTYEATISGEGLDGQGESLIFRWIGLLGIGPRTGWMSEIGIEDRIRSSEP